MTASIAALILAAGTSSRFRAAGGTEPTKLVAVFEGAPLVRRVAEAALASRARPVIAITGHAADHVRAALFGLPLIVAHNPDFASGLASSLRTGLDAVPADCGGALVLLGDMPAVTPRLIDAILARFADVPDLDGVVPSHRGRRGNPALLGRTLFARALRLEGDEGARRLLSHAHVAELDFDDAAVGLDVDDPSHLIGPAPPL